MRIEFRGNVRVQHARYSGRSARENLLLLASVPSLPGISSVVHVGRLLSFAALVGWWELILFDGSTRSPAKALMLRRQHERVER